MLKRVASILLLSALCVSNLLIASGELQAQEIIPEIKAFNPLGFYPGVVMAIEGGPFIPQNEHMGSFVVFDGDVMDTFFESSSRLVFVVPMYAACAPNHYVFVRTISGTHEEPVFAESTREDVVVQCTEDRPYGPRPRIKEVIHSSHVTAGQEPIYVRGFDILPFSPQDGYPHTLVHYTRENYVGTTELTYHKFGEVSFILDVEHCGTYNVTLRNYYSNKYNYVESSDYDIEVTNGCDGIDPVVGGYSLSLSGLPESAQVGETYPILLDVDFNGGFGTHPMLEVILNGQAVETQQVNIYANAVSQIPLNISFTEPGLNTLQVSIEGEVVEATIEVGGVATPAGPTPGPSPVPPGADPQLSTFDIDGDCVLNQLEYNSITDAWISEQVSEAFFFMATDYWIEQRNICTGAASRATLRVEQRLYAMSFTAAGTVTALQIDVFDPSGRSVISQSAHGNRLAWTMRDQNGARVANGVYIVSITQTRWDGTTDHELKKIMVLR